MAAVMTQEGPGPFPAIVWNHGSEKDPGRGPQFDTVAKMFVPAGYVVFAPMRRGHGESQGPYIVELRGYSAVQSPQQSTPMFNIKIASGGA